MQGDSNFRFEYLQPTGGSLKSLTVPALSSNYVWSAGSIVPKNAKVSVTVHPCQRSTGKCKYHTTYISLVPRLLAFLLIERNNYGGKK